MFSKQPNNMPPPFGFQASHTKRKHERERFIFLIASGVAFSLLIILFVVLNYKSNAIAKIDNQPKIENQAPSTTGTVMLIAPERLIPTGTKLSDVKFKEVLWPQNQVPEGAINDIAQLKDLYAAEPLRAAFPIQRSQLSNEPLQTSLPVTPGNRAVAIEVDAISGVEGHVVPGTKVDITLTFFEQGTLTTKVIVQNARVLSYGGETKADKTARSGARAVSRSVTLDVSAADALKIQTARKLGTMSLILRSIEDDKSATSLEITENDLSSNKVKKESKATTCGRVRVGGKEYIMNCDGSIAQLVAPEGE
ncbi:MAG TPA: Flp pilus assembly protein CpaB [Oligoflexia bacterium]|nr:Flp pilus assembly protein CpaB [Oligoflexia bacterium]HMP27428.1 Flp pilus assembly protein CpaB [Oligoflexia bacterium]